MCKNNEYKNIITNKTKVKKIDNKNVLMMFYKTTSPTELNSPKTIKPIGSLHERGKYKTFLLRISKKLFAVRTPPPEAVA